jgi:hypothetical protein
VDMASQQNSNSYHVRNQEELKKLMETAPIDSKIIYEEESDKDIPTIMSKDQSDGLIEMNNKSVRKQVKKKKDDSIDELRKEISELKEVMKLQIEVDKMRKNQQMYNILDNKEQKVYNKMTKNQSKIDDNGYLDLTKEESNRLSPKGKVSPFSFSEEINTPMAKDSNPLDSPSEINISNNGETKKGLANGNISINKKIKSVNRNTHTILFIFGVFAILCIFFLGLNILLKVNYFLSAIFSLVITFGISLTIYLTKIKVPEHQLPRKETAHYNDFELAEAKRCPSCNSKLQKSKVIQGGDGYKQYIKCSSIECDYRKTLEVKKENGY